MCRARACPTLAAVVTGCRCHVSPLYCLVQHSVYTWTVVNTLYYYAGSRPTFSLLRLSALVGKAKNRRDKEYTYYKVLWKGYPPEIATWELESGIHDDFIDEYEAAIEAEAELEAEEAAELEAEEAEEAAEEAAGDE